MNYIAWALLGMAGYSTVTLFVKLATRTGELNAFAVLAIATTVVWTSTMSYAIGSGAFAGKAAADFLRPGALWAFATGVVLFVAVGSLFKALSLGPASVVVPIYGMFIVGGAALAVIFLGEPVTLNKIVGVALCAAGVYLVAA